MSSPLKVAPFTRGSGPHLTHDSLGPPPIQAHNPNGILIGSAVFAGLTSVTDRSTDRQHYSVGSNSPHLRIRSTAMRPNNNVIADITSLEFPSECPHLQANFMPQHVRLVIPRMSPCITRITIGLIAVLRT